MKRLITLLLAFSIIFSFSGCGKEEITSSNQDGTGGKVFINQGQNDLNKNYGDNFDEEEVKKQLAVKTYGYNSDYWNYGFIEVANNSQYDLDVTVYAKFFDSEGNLIGAEDSSQEAFQQGTEILFYFMPDEEFSAIEYSFSVKEEEYYDCVVKDLTYESVTAKDKEIVSVTNNGSEVAEFVEGSMLFFKGDKVVDFERNYFTDDDSELKPGATITEEMNCYAKYDSYKFYLTGRR